MADITSILDPNTILQFAGMNDTMGWIGVGITILVQILVGGILLVIIAEIFGRHWGEHIAPANAFFAVIIATIVNTIGIMGMLSSLLPFGYYSGLLLSVIVWFVLIKAFFSDFELKHALIMSVAVVLANMFVLPYIIGIIVGALGF